MTGAPTWHARGEALPYVGQLAALPTLPDAECEGLQRFSLQQYRKHSAPGYAARRWKNLAEDFDEQAARYRHSWIFVLAIPWPEPGWALHRRGEERVNPVPAA
jgi:hypothetical protein